MIGCQSKFWLFILFLNWILIFHLPIFNKYLIYIYFNSKPVYAMVIERVDGISRLLRIKGPTNPAKAVRDAPER